MKVFLDTNILLDVLLARTPFLARSAEVLNLCAASAVAGYASVLSFTTAFVSDCGCGIVAIIGGLDDGTCNVSRRHIMPITQSSFRLNC